MVSKGLVIATVVVLLAVGIVVFGFSEPPEEIARATITGQVIGGAVPSSDSKVAVDVAKSSFNFEGFGPGRSHVGTFNDWGGFLFVEDGKIIGLESRINAASVDTGIDRLNGYLPGKEFFDAAKFPEITFVSNSMSATEMSGVLVFRGVSEQISFPIETTENGISADFILDTTVFGMKYVAVNKEVRIFFELRI